MDKEESRTDLGIVRIHKNVIASIAAVASAEVEGVKRIGANLKSGMMEFIGKKTYSAIGVDFDKNGEVKVEIPLIIKYGYNIPGVADRVQENVRNALEKMTNLSIKDINIIIQGIERG
jgi:uncharacterized alkaline shock family protein YloU